MMDWTKVKLPEQKRPKRFQAGELSELDHAKILVISQLLKKSVSSIVQTALYTYINRNWAEHEQRLIAEATRDGVTPEEKFCQLMQQDE
jgi:hypothetical protein